MPVNLVIKMPYSETPLLSPELLDPTIATHSVDFPVKPAVAGQFQEFFDTLLDQHGWDIEGSDGTVIRAYEAVDENSGGMVRVFRNPNNDVTATLWLIAKEDGKKVDKSVSFGYDPREANMLQYREGMQTYLRPGTPVDDTLPEGVTMPPSKEKIKEDFERFVFWVPVVMREARRSTPASFIGSLLRRAGR